MANKTASGLVSFAKSKLGTAYVYGMKGAVLTAEKYKELKNRYGSYVWNTDKNKIGKVCTDCSGLISWYTGTVRNSTAYNQTAVKVLPISQIDKAVAGCAVWRKGHIGVYIGNGEIIEARGSQYGVVKTKVKDRDFTHILWLKDIDYTTTTKTEYYPKCSYTGVSIVDALKSIGVNSTLANRKKIAAVNGMTSYTGKAAENTKLLELLKAGRLTKAV